MTHADIINFWPSISEFADDIGVSYGTAKAMRQRISIPSEYFTRIVDAATERNIEGVTYEVLCVAAHDRKFSTTTERVAS